MSNVTITVEASSVLVNAAKLQSVLFIGSDGTLSINIASDSDRHFFWAPLEGEKAFEMDFRDLPARRDDVLPIDVEHLEATATGLARSHAINAGFGALLITPEGTHIIIKHVHDGFPIKVNLTTKKWEYIDDNELGLIADAWTLNGYVDGRIVVSVPCKARLG